MARARPVTLAIATLLTAMFARPASAQATPTVNNGLVSVQRGQTLQIDVTGSNLAGVTTTGMRDAEGLDATLVKSDKPEMAMRS